MERTHSFLKNRPRGDNIFVFFFFGVSNSVITVMISGIAFDRVAFHAGIFRGACVGGYRSS